MCVSFLHGRRSRWISAARGGVFFRLFPFFGFKELGAQDFHAFSRFFIWLVFFLAIGTCSWVCAISERRIPFVRLRWFPAPPERHTSMRRSSRRISMSTSSASGMTATVAVGRGCAPRSQRERAAHGARRLHISGIGTSLFPAMRQTTSPLNPPTSDGLLSRCARSASRVLPQNAGTSAAGLRQTGRLHPRLLRRGFQ